MRHFLPIFYTTTIILGGMAMQAFAMNKIEERQLKALDPQTRLEQRCDIEAMDRLSHETKFSADKVLAYAYSDPIMGSHKIIAKGAAFRAKGKWYHLSYDCRTEDDNMTIHAFSYKIGNVIPRNHWDAHYLVP